MQVLLTECKKILFVSPAAGIPKSFHESFEAEKSWEYQEQCQGKDIKVKLEHLIKEDYICLIEFIC